MPLGGDGQGHEPTPVVSVIKGSHQPGWRMSTALWEMIGVEEVVRGRIGEIQPPNPTNPHTPISICGTNRRKAHVPQ